MFSKRHQLGRENKVEHRMNKSETNQSMIGDEPIERQTWIKASNRIKSKEWKQKRFSYKIKNRTPKRSLHTIRCLYHRFSAHWTHPLLFAERSRWLFDWTWFGCLHAIGFRFLFRNAAVVALARLHWIEHHFRQHSPFWFVLIQIWLPSSWSTDQLWHLQMWSICLLACHHCECE